MDTLKEQFIRTWQIHQRMNRLLINNTSDAGMKKTLSTRGGRTIFRQWLHIEQVRRQWLDTIASDINSRHPSPKNPPAEKKELMEMLDRSAQAIGELLEQGWETGGKIKGFTQGAIPFLGYLISHESHHRGNMVITLKQSGEKLPDAIKWGLWEWGK